MNPSRPSLLVIGATVVYDYIFRVDHLPQPGKTAKILPVPKSQMQPSPGGTAFNIALGLAKLNEPVRLAHPVGYDFGDSAYEHQLREAGVDLEGLLVNQDYPSGFAYVFGASDGTTLCFTSSIELPVLQIPESTFVGVDLIVLTPLMGPWHRQAGDYIQRHETSLALCGVAEPEVLTWLPQMFVLAINEYEMHLLSTIENSLTPIKISQRMPGYLFITQGAKGCDVYQQGKRLGHVAAIPAEQVIDTTGAGDAFFAATLAGLRRGLGPLEAAQMGVAAGSLVVEVLGCQANLPDWLTLTKRLRNYYPDLATQLERFSRSETELRSATRVNQTRLQEGE